MDGININLQQRTGSQHNMDNIFNTVNSSDSLNIDMSMTDEKHYNYLLNLASKRSGVPVAEIKTGMNKIAWVESKNKPKEYQKSNVLGKDGITVIGTTQGPGAGKYQYERGSEFGGKNAARVAMNRLYAYLGGDLQTGKQPDVFPEWMQKHFPKNKWGNITGTQLSVDASQLTSEQQDMLFLADKLAMPGASFQGIGNPEWAAKYHYSNPDTASQEEYIRKYKRDMESFK